MALGSAGTAFVEIRPDLKGFGPALKSGVQGSLGGISGMAKQITSSLGGISTATAASALGFATLGAGASQALGAIAGAVGGAINAAASLGEATSAVKNEFGAAAESVLKFAETAPDIGITETAALKAAVGFGAMAQSAGLSESAAASLSTRLVTLASDLGSFFDTDPTEMLDRLRSGLAGEAEPLRQFGIFISEARVQSEAAALGIGKVGQALTDAQKIQARFNIIMKDSAPAIGDFGRTLETSLPNQLRKLKAELGGLQASLGEALLPVTLDATKAFANMVGPLSDIVTWLNKIKIAGVGAVEILSKIPRIPIGFPSLPKGGELTGLQATLVGPDIERIRQQSQDFLNSVKADAVATAQSIAKLTADQMQGLARVLDTTFADLKAGMATAFAEKGQGGVQAFFDDTIASAKQFADAFAESLNFVKQSLTDLASQDDLTAGKILKTFDAQLQTMAEFGANVETIAGAFGDVADPFIESVTAMGEQGAGILDAVARDIEKNSGKTAAKIIADFNEAGSAAGALGSSISGTIGGSLTDIRSILIDIAHGFGIKLTLDDNVSAGLASIKDLLSQITGTHAVEVLLTAPGMGNFRPAQHGFHGVVTRPTLFLAGEAGRETVHITPQGQATSSSSHGGPGGQPTRVYNISVNGSSPSALDIVRELDWEERKTRYRSPF